MDASPSQTESFGFHTTKLSEESRRTFKSSQTTKTVCQGKIKRARALHEQQHFGLPDSPFYRLVDNLFVMRRGAFAAGSGAEHFGVEEEEN